jgi:glucokinase
MILAGDIGGTHTRLAIFEGDPERLTTVLNAVYPSRAHAGLEEIASDFVSKHKVAISAACFGVAGPVLNGRCETSNLPWIVDARNLGAALGIAAVTLVNDLEANAHGIALLADSDFVTLNAGEPAPTGNRALISAGTGLGEAGLLFTASGYLPVASEGGHADFAPRNETEIELLRFLMARFDHVSYERVLSGPGLLNIYTFLRETGRAAEPAWFAEQLRAGDPAAAIANAAIAEQLPICVEALEMFASIYGAEAGNVGLQMMATGGVYVGGGIAPKIAPKLDCPAFLQAFTAKGRMARLLESIPVRIVMNENTALLGAGRVEAITVQRLVVHGV